MLFDLHSPAPNLRTVVKTIWRVQGSRQEFSAPEPIVPDGCVEIILNLGDPFTGEDGQFQPRALLAGQMTRPVVAKPSGNVDLLGIRFFSGSAGGALGLPMRELQDCLTDASAVAPRLHTLADNLRNMPCDQRIYGVERELARLLRTERTSSGAVDHALALIGSHGGNVRIDRIARTVGVTRRHLERLFQNAVGLSVKQMARIVRVHAAVRLMERNRDMSGAEISAHCGYSDQAHLIRECKALTGRTPARLMTSERSLAGLMREEAAARSR